MRVLSYTNKMLLLLSDGGTVTTPEHGSVTNSSGTTFKISSSIWFSVAVLFKSVTIL